MTHTRALARYVADLRLEALPPSVVAAAGRATLDLIGVVFPAGQYQPARLMNDYVRHTGGRPVATVIGTDIRTSPASAALANGTMAAEMEQDDVHPQSGTHPASVYIPAMLGIAKEFDVSGAQWVEALVCAYDVGCRVSMALGFANQYGRGFHATGVSGIFGATAGVSHLLGLDADAVESAFGLAGAQASGLTTYEMEQEHFAKSLQSGAPARNAVVAAELAAMGYRGAPGTLDGKNNIFTAFSTHTDFSGLTADLGRRFEIEHTGYKFYSACRAIHTPLDILLGLMREEGLGPDDVAGIDVWLPTELAPVVDNNALTTHNLRYIMAVAMVDREITRVQISAGRRADPALAELSKRVRLLRDDQLGQKYPRTGMLGPARLELRLADGRVFSEEREGPSGSTALPASDADLERKFLQMTRQVISERRALQIAAVLQRIETVPSMRELTALLGAA